MLLDGLVIGARKNATSRTKLQPFIVTPSFFRARSENQPQDARRAPTLDPHVFQKPRPDLGLVDNASGSVVIIADHHNVEDVARDIAAKDGIGSADGLHI
jgi:hypothetical protein